MTQTFPSIQASFGLSKNSNPNVKEIKFGDGYAQRVTFGLNQNLKDYSLSWNNITETEANQIESFLDLRSKDNASFLYTPPQESTAKHFICKSWSRGITYAGKASISATFNEVKQP